MIIYVLTLALIIVEIIVIIIVAQLVQIHAVKIVKLAVEVMIVRVDVYLAQAVAEINVMLHAAADVLVDAVVLLAIPAGLDVLGLVFLRAAVIVVIQVAQETV